ncbi:zf-HC2 domain-containing protein [Anaerotignum sp.]|uniref:zf-HC2 domain-containing protein n=1 Tax=Anaerotignum sp. TaxID=2039241 RepID=UPI0033321ACE
MSCDKCKELLWAYLAQELNMEDANFVAMHLEQCKVCQEEAVQLQKIMDSLRNLPEEELPEGYHDELMDKLAQETKVVPLPVRKKPQYKWKQFSLVAAAALLVVAVGGAQGVLSLRGNQNEIVQEMSEGGAEDMNNSVVANTEDSQDSAVGATGVAEQAEKMEATPKVAPEVVPKQEKQLNAPQGTQNQAQQKAMQAEPESLPKAVSQKEEGTAPIAMNQGQEDSASKLGNLETRGFTYTLMDEEPSVEAQQQVILTVENKEGMIDNVRTLATSLGGYEVGKAEDDTLKISIPSTKSADFVSGLKKLGETRSIELSTEKTDDVIFEVTVESK